MRRKPVNEVSAAEFAKLRKKGPRKGWYRRSSKEDRTVDGQTFDSAAEMKRYLELKRLRFDGDVLYFLRQPRFDLLGLVYKADFQVFWAGGVTGYEEVQGKGWCHPGKLARFRRNREQVKVLYGVEIKLVEVE